MTGEQASLVLCVPSRLWSILFVGCSFLKVRVVTLTGDLEMEGGVEGKEG
jgi:hypothetical protein